MRNKREYIRHAVVLVFILAFVTSALAQTPTPRANGKIAFTSDRDANREIYVMNADGKNQVRLTNNSVVDDHPTWSPDGTKIAFVSQRPSGAFAIFQMNADGTNKAEITPVNYIVNSPAWFSDYWSMSWSPDGNRIAFQDNWDIFVVNADGSNRQRLTDASGYDHEPSWSPDGSKILFASARGGRMYPSMYTVNPNGTGLQDFPGLDAFQENAPNWSPTGAQVLFVVNGTDDISLSIICIENVDGTNRYVLDGDWTEFKYRNKPSWSPDGSKIIFDMWEYRASDMEIYVKNTNGSGFAQLTNTSGWNFHPSWQPLARAACPNPIDCADFFVRQHYLDFLGREPDPPGFAAWQAVLNNCLPGDTSCDRVHVSGAFFQSPEFQERGYFAYRQYSVAFGRKPDFAEFVPDLQRVSGFLTNEQLEAAKVALIADFMARPAFVNIYNGLGNTAYLDTLLSTAGVTLASRQSLIDALNAGSKTRAQVFREIMESVEVYQKYYNQSFVVMQYFGYLRRDPDALYLNWIAVLDSTGDPRHMINGFVNSLEYRQRFGP